MKTGSFILGAAAGLAVATTVLHATRPDVTNKMMRNGKRMFHRYCKHLGIG